MVAMVNQGKAMKNAVLLYIFGALENPENIMRSIPIDGSLIHSLKQVRITYLAVSLDKELRIYDIPTGNLIRTILTNQPFQFLFRVNSINYIFEYDMEAEACLGYSYKTFF